MDELINKLFVYLKTRDNSILLTATTSNRIKKLDIIILNILDWMKLERKRSTWIEEGRKVAHKPMEINFDYPWCKELSEILKNEEIFNINFKITDKGFEFADSISENEREKARETVFNRYKPITMIN